MNQSTSRGSLVAGVVLIGLGILFLIGQFLDISIWEFLWPFTIIGFGALFFVGMVAGGKSAGPLAIPGSIITMIGAILLFQNLFGYWESWAYAWTLILTAVGIGLIIYGRWSDRVGARQSGSAIIKLSLLLLIIFGAFFELLIGISGRRDSGLLWPVILIGLGLYFLLAQSGILRRRQAPIQPTAPRETVPEPPAAGELPPEADPRS